MLPRFILALFFLTCNAFAAMPEIDEILSRDFPHPFHGVALITQNDHIIYEHSNVDGFTINTPFKIASLSKQVTAVLALQLVEKGQLNLDTKIANYLPNIGDNWANEVTVHQLLNHSSGIEDLGKPLLFKPGSQFKYSNISYDLTAQIIEKITNKTYGHLVDELFASIGMKNSFSPSHTPQRNFIEGYTEESDGSFHKSHNTISEPSGGLISSAADLIKWDQALHKDKTLLAEHTYKMLTTKFIAREHRHGNMHYGYGLQIIDTSKGLEYSHNGYIDGYISTLIYYPTQDISIALLENISWRLDDDIGRVFALQDSVRKHMLD